jgi:hypothetical protein
MVTPDVKDKAFLDLFPRTERSPVATMFLNVIRRGVDTEGRVIQAVAVALGNKIVDAEHWLAVSVNAESPWSDDYRARVERLRQWHHILDTNFDAAVAYAGYCLAYEALPREEREKFKAGRPTNPDWGSEPATDKQKAYLTGALRYTGDMQGMTKRQASELIAWLKKEQVDGNDGHGD